MRRKDIKLIIICALTVLLVCAVVHYAWPAKEGTRISREDIAEYKYVASVNSKPFHYPGCRWAKKIYSENLIGFVSRQEALDSGRRPCKVCKP